MAPPMKDQKGWIFDAPGNSSLLTLLQLPEILTKLREFQQKNHLEVDKFKYFFLLGGRRFFSEIRIVLSWWMLLDCCWAMDWQKSHLGDVYVASQQN